MKLPSNIGRRVARALQVTLLASALAATVGVGSASAWHCGGGGYVRFGHFYGRPYGHRHFVHVYPRHYGYGHYYYSYPRPFRHLYPRGHSFSISISNVPPGGYYYYDPYCRERFATLDLYLDHLYGFGHPRIIEAIATQGGSPAYACRYDGGRWRIWD